MRTRGRSRIRQKGPLATSTLWQFGGMLIGILFYCALNWALWAGQTGGVSHCVRLHALGSEPEININKSCAHATT